MSTWNNLYGGVYGNKSYQTYGNTKSYSIPNTDLITSGNTETITINTTFSKAIDAMMTKILKYITSQGVMDKKLICQGNTDQIKNSFQKYNQIIQQLGSLFSRFKNASSPTKTNKNEAQDRLMEDKLIQLINLPNSSKLQEQIRLKVHQAGFKYNNKTKIQDFIYTACQNIAYIKSLQSQAKELEEKRMALQQTINYLDDETNKMRLPSKLQVLNEEMTRKINKLMENKQTLITVSDILKPFRANQRGYTEKLSQKILAPLQNLLKQINHASRQNKDNKESTDSKTLALIASINHLNVENYVSYEKSIQTLDITTRQQLNKIKLKLQNAKKINQKQEQSSNKAIQFGSYPLQNNERRTVKHAQTSQSNSHLPKQNEKNEIDQKSYNLFLQMFNKMKQLKNVTVEENQKTRQDIKKGILAMHQIQSLKLELQTFKNKQIERQRRQALKMSQSTKNKNKYQVESQTRQQQLQKEAVGIKKLNSEFQKRQELLKNDIAALKQQLDSELANTDRLKRQIQHFNSHQIQLNVKIANFQLLIKQKAATIHLLTKQNEQYRGKIHQLEQQVPNGKFEILEEQQVIEQQPNMQYFGPESWVSTEQTKQAGDTLIKEIQKINNKHFKNSTLLYRYSPQIKLQWQHFVNRPNILIAIKTNTNKFIAIYTLASLPKPNEPIRSEKIEEKAFIFQHTINGGETCVYPLLPGKKAHGSYSNTFAVGKSDLRFTLTDNNIQGNFGYSGCFFDNKGKKISNLLGGTKVKMVAYQIYSITLSGGQVSVNTNQNFTTPSKKGVQSKNTQQRPSSVELNQINSLKKQVEKRDSALKDKTEYSAKQQQKIKDLKEELDRIAMLQQSKLNKTMNQNKTRQRQQQNIDSIKKQHFEQTQQLNKDLLYQIEQCRLNTDQLQKSYDERYKAQQKFKEEIDNLKKQLANRQTQAINRTPGRQTYYSRDLELERITKIVLPEKQTVITKAMKDIEGFKTQIINLKRDIEVRNAQINNLKRENEQLSFKLIEAELKGKQLEKLRFSPSKRPSIKEDKRSGKNMRFTESSRTEYQQYEQMANICQIEPSLVAHINRFFDTNLLEGRLDDKIKLVREMERIKGFNFCKAKLLFEYDQLNTISFHKYIDEVPNILLIIQTIKGVTVAGYYSGVYTKKQPMLQPGLLISLGNNESYELYPPSSSLPSKYERTPRLMRGMTYDDFFILFGNAELRIRANEKTVFSNFGISNGYFNNRGKKVQDLLGDGENRELEFKSYEIYQVFFEGQGQRSHF